MKLFLDEAIANKYESNAQRARVLSESWVDKEIYCPNCGHLEIDKYPNNQPVADFSCSNCHEDYELKSKQGSLGSKIVDGAYRTMLERLTSSSNPNFFLMDYDVTTLQVRNFLVVPKHFFVPEIIERRKPLAVTARRAGWVGCNILLNHIPQTGKIFLVRDKKAEPKARVLAEWQKTLFLREEKEVTKKGWPLDVMRSIDKIGKSEFTLDDVYAFESELSRLHPDNRHIKDKIRQQLQFLRDRGYVRFLGGGKYQRT
ncbi:restriction endonuclease [Candidatus Kaiserbacteria bacterium RIFCSPHIGHO2_02_FULL_55_20]|uniref:Restriction endonuclease n=1 Tax=Candidatus Kaiserbacteria bacterium RIFCSPHIGHO2_02_FULL_55_20 TaxID=1798497 RepID=A0A1F6DX72_9BACT|nr:MAG: restriction endonuclease [Candidatus Kaiserbacteria bacterium RIFCSPHIGHO2_01_FULL_55_37]OGG65880.1 MAG: restriction endonuclease [Candidatus Kaiserbacteria bacterium RIFCSPHIGHO2_02_FULL_55_20]